MSKLTQRIKEKYPQYANVPDKELEKRVLARYPQYQPYASKSVGGFAGNIFKSGGRLVGDTVGAVANIFNPDMEKNTVANLGKLGLGAAQLLIPGEQGYEDNARAVGDFYKQRYGGMENIGDTLYNDPMGAAADIATLLTGGGAALRGAGSLSKASGLARTGQTLSKAGRAVDPMMAAGKVVSDGIGRAASRTAPKLNAAADRAATAGIGNPAAQAKMARQGGRSVASFIDEYDLYNRSPEAALDAQKSILGQYDNLALNSGKQVPMGQIITAFDAEIERLSKGVGGVVSDADKAKIAALLDRKQMLLDASGATYHSPVRPQQKLTIGADGVMELKPESIDPALREKFMSAVPINVGVDTLTNFRRKVIDPDVPQSMFGLDARGSGSAQGVKRSRDIVKGAIDSSDPRLKKLGRDYGMAKGLTKIMDQSAARQGNRQMFNFSKLGSAGVGSVVAGAPGVVAGFAFEQAANNPRVLKAASKTFRSAANAASNPTLKKTAQRATKTISTGYEVGRSASRLNPDQKTAKSANKQREPLVSQSQPYTDPFKKRSNFQNSVSRRMGVSY